MLSNRNWDGQILKRVNKRKRESKQLHIQVEEMKQQLKKQIAEGVEELRLLHSQGAEMKERLKPAKGKTYLDPRCEKKGNANDTASTHRKADKMMSFAKEYTKQDLNQLIRICEKHERVLNFGIVRILLSVKDKTVRKQLQVKAAKECWKKPKLQLEIAQRKATPAMRERATGKQTSSSGRGRRPAAVASVDALVSELLNDARKWKQVN